MKRSFKTAVFFSLIVFVIMLLTMVSVGGCMVLLYISGVGPMRIPGLPLILFLISSLVVGTILSHVVGKRPLAVITDISEATQRVAKGDFDVRLNEDIRAEELRVVAVNFNRMAAELKQIEMFRSDFISNVSHEFKTPLAAIDGYVTLLQNPSLSEDKRQTYTQKILRHTRQLSSLTGNVLLLSRLENQEFTMQRSPYSLDEQLRECILLYEKDWIDKHIDLDVDLDGTDYTGNAELMQHVWQNLLGNAIKFTPEGERITVFMCKTKEGVSVTVSDSGIGMDEKVLSRMYEKFYQGDSSHSGSGNGLGLTLVKRIVDLHGGSIAVRSRLGEGTAFTICLPEYK